MNPRQETASPPTARVLDVLEAVAGRPGTRWTLTDLTRTTGMTRATAHAVLSTLTERDWLRRDPSDKAYVVGPALSLLGRHLAAARPADVLAGDAAAKVAAETGYTAVVVEVVADAVVVVDVAAAPGRTTPITVGSKVPYVPPFGPGFAAWAPDEERERWLGRAEAVNPALGDRLRRVLPVIAERGYSLERFDSASASVFEALALLQDDVLGDAVREVLGRVLATLTQVDFLPEELHGEHVVTSIAAPIRDGDGRVVLNVVLQPRGTHSADDLRAMGETVRHAADAVSRSIGGTGR